ncbi:MAG TPA: LemA family protein [Waterburya sp.]|jgi:LemA protein
MNNPEVRIPEDIATEVLALASRYYAHSTQSYSVSELVQAGSEVQIPAELIEQAIQEIQAQRSQKLEQQKRSRYMHQMLLKIGAGIVAVNALWSIWTYNSLSREASNVEAAWAQVENQLQRRADLIPNLVSVTQAYAKHEQQLVSLLVQSRETYLRAVTPQEKAAAIAQVNQAIERFTDYAAANPQWRSSQLFINLQYEIAGTENRIAVERMRYNKAVQSYNQQIQQFPTSVLANVFEFRRKSFFATTPI